MSGTPGEAESARLADVVALDQLAYRYAAPVDACDREAFALFTPDRRLRS